MALPAQRCDDALARPILFQGPGEHGGGIFEGVGALLGHDLDYGADGKERVTADALADVDGWVGRPVVTAGAAHDPKRIKTDPGIQGRTAIGTILSSRFDAATGERIHRFAVHDPANVAKIRSGALGELSEAYTPTTRDPSPEERADGITAVQTSRRPQSLALVPRARAGRRARIRADGDIMDPEEKAGEFSLDALAATIAAIPDDSEFADAIAAILATKIAKLATKEMEKEGSPQKPVTDAPLPAEMEAMKADAAKQRARADAAEAELRKVRLSALRADATADGLTVPGLDKTDPSADDIAAAEKAYADAAIAKVRADAAKGRADGQRRNPLSLAPTGAPGRADGAKKPTYIPSAS